VLDYGCGTGNLAIAAATHGAARPAGTHLDPHAIDAAAGNAQRNGVDSTFMSVDALQACTFDLVVANILANPLRLLAPALAARTAGDGCIALSGIHETQRLDVIAAYRDAFAIDAWRVADGWVLLAGAKQASLTRA
jgi:ribosomal protein L11 methyltransferase